jgi:hypothetical protein
MASGSGASLDHWYNKLLCCGIMGLRDGLELARKLDIAKLIVEVDAKAVVDIILSENNLILETHPYSALIHDCRYMIQSFEEAILHHIHREGNFCADLLSKARCISDPVFSEFISPPSFVVSQLLADIWGVSYPVLCNLFCLFN